MIISNFRLLFFCIILMISQFIINNYSYVYVDLLAIVLVSILMRGEYSWSLLITLSLIADLVGHWYLGSHLLATVILSLFSGKFVNFYRMCSWFQRTIISSIFFLFMVIIILLVELMTGRVFISQLGLIFELFLLLPLIQAILNLAVFRRPEELVFND